MKIQVYIYDQNKKTERFYEQALSEYDKRLGRYCNIKYKIFKKEKAWKKMLDQQTDAGIVIVPGKTISSEKFSKTISNWEISGEKTISFYILNEEIDSWREKYSDILAKEFSLSNYDMGPMMQAIVLYEQIYRGYRIMHHHPYHK